MSLQNNKSGRRRKGRSNKPNRGSRDLVSGIHPNGQAASLSRVSEAFMPLFPPRTFKTLRYATNVSVATTSGAVNTYVFRANDLFDPDYTSTGHQPMGFDQMMVFYNHFHVQRSRITVTCGNTAAGSEHAGLRVDASLTPLTSSDQIREFGGCVIEVLEAKNTYGSAKVLSMSADIKRLQGIGPRTDITANPNLGGDAGTSPTELTYYHLFVYDPNSLSGTVNFDVIIEYDTWFTEPRDATLSLPTTKPVAECKSSLKDRSPGCFLHK